MLAVFLLNALGLSLGYFAARAAGLAPADRRAVSIEVGIQNSGLGLILIFNFFGGTRRHGGRGRLVGHLAHPLGPRARDLVAAASTARTRPHW